ncbi:MAG: hypothetical protein IKO41_09025 [Lachnospiraceae bacterium]|nr:hypothetical protein [Lachnospiraceae bacterium]
MKFRTESGSIYKVDTARKTVVGPETGFKEVPYADMSSVLSHTPVVIRLVVDGVQRMLMTSPVSWAHV